MRRFRAVRVVVLSVGIATVFLGGTAFADPNIVHAMGLDVWHIGQLERDLQESRAIESKLEWELNALADRAAEHNLMLEDLVEGRASLVDTAKRKLEMNRHHSEMLDYLREHRSGANLEAKMAHDLCIQALSRTAERQTANQELSKRLKTEYEAAYEQSYPIR